MRERERASERARARARERLYKETMSITTMGSTKEMLEWFQKANPDEPKTKSVKTLLGDDTGVRLKDVICNAIFSRARVFD